MAPLQLLGIRKWLAVRVRAKLLPLAGPKAIFLAVAYKPRFGQKPASVPVGHAVPQNSNGSRHFDNYAPWNPDAYFTCNPFKAGTIQRGSNRPMNYMTKHNDTAYRTAIGYPNQE
ncbi:uncharacterized protein LOC124409161 [Diprion similis]|uniref:uncharacterized protein LOC124409161 n=1 Tax=Diprion similis TaxID=362088 RepID=UPI001EF888FF|nr:uncharacterized protein LOC124409161 [Diprion similis]